MSQGAGELDLILKIDDDHGHHDDHDHDDHDHDNGIKDWAE